MSFSLDVVRPSDSPFVERVWHMQSDQTSDFTSVASVHSGLVITTYEGKVTLSVRGPETIATSAVTPANGEFIGVDFKLGVFMPSLLPKNLLDRRDVHLPVSSSGTFWLDCAPWEIPDYENADTFIERLVREGLLAHDPIVQAAVEGQVNDLSPRSVQRRFLQATGLTVKAVQQIERAQQALALLGRGRSILDTTYELGYFDQSHLTNSLKRFVGQTPAQIMYKPE